MFGLFFVVSLYGQQNRRCKVISDFDQPIELDTLTVLPSTFSFSERVQFTFDADNRLLIVNPISNNTHIEVCYDVLGVLITEEYNLHKRAQGHQRDQKQADEQLSDINQQSGLVSSGIINRGVNAGNTQDLSVDSYMDFRLKGKISEEIAVEARLFDRNIPYQPEGNTHQIKNFDRIYVKVNSESTETILGDITLADNDEHFVKYNKAVIGGAFNYKDSLHDLTVGVGVNKGKFGIDFIDGIEGNFGPYNIKGPETDPFIIIIAGTEKVYLDEVLLQRGVDKDYVIDYDLSEITFMPTVIISDYSRIRIEFEYRNLGLMRSVKKVNYVREGKKVSWSMSYLSEKDQFSGISDIIPETIWQQMQNGQATVQESTHTEVNYEPGRISYILIDTVSEVGTHHIAYQYSIDENDQHYRVNFFFQGEKAGNYIKQYTSQGQLFYKWVSPLQGVPQGNYEPLVTWKSPIKQEFYSGRMNAKLSEFDRFDWQFAMSSTDDNTLFDGESDLTRGFGSKLNIFSEQRKFGSTSKYNWSYNTDLEYHSRSLSLINPVFSPDFNREWGRNELLYTEGVSDLISSFGFKLGEEKKNVLDYKFKFRNKGELINGESHYIKVDKSFEKWKVIGLYKNIKNNNSEFFSLWTYQQANIEHISKSFITGMKVIIDKNTIWNDSEKNTLVSSFQNFEQVEWYLRSSGDSSAFWKVDYQTRTNFMPKLNEMVFADKSSTIRALGGFNKDDFRADVSLQHRLLSSKDLNTSNLMGRVNLRKAFFKEMVVLNQKLSTVNGLEPRRDFVYVEVPAGQGFYTWIDENKDGVQQPNEFYEALFHDEKRFVRLFVPGTERIAVYNNTLSTSLDWHFPDGWLKKSIPLKLLAGISGNTFYSSNTKIKSESDVRLISLLRPQMRDTSVLGGKEFFRTSIVYENPVYLWSVGYDVIHQSNKNWINTGYEFKQRQVNKLYVYFSLGNSDFEITGEKGRKNAHSELSISRNYQYDEKAGGTSWGGIWGNVSHKLSYKLTQKASNLMDENRETITLNDIELKFDYRIRNDFMLGGNFLYSYIEAPEIENKVMMYELLNGGQKGSNYRWNISLRKTIFQEVEAIVYYFGRKSLSKDVIHQANIQLSARF